MNYQEIVLVLMKERLFVDLIHSFKLFFFYFSLPFSSLSLGKEARKRELKKVRKEIWNIYLAFPVLCVMFVIIMGHEW